jgi:hypothetical protein
MMGRPERGQEQLFYSFCLDEVVPDLADVFDGKLSVSEAGGDGYDYRCMQWTNRPCHRDGRTNRGAQRK